MVQMISFYLSNSYFKSVHYCIDIGKKMFAIKFYRKNTFSITKNKTTTTKKNVL